MFTKDTTFLMLKEKVCGDAMWLQMIASSPPTYLQPNQVLHPIRDNLRVYVGRDENSCCRDSGPEMCRGQAVFPETSMTSVINLILMMIERVGVRKCADFCLFIYLCLGWKTPLSKDGKKGDERTLSIQLHQRSYLPLIFLRGRR